MNLYFVRQTVWGYIEANIDHFYDFITIDPSKYISNMRKDGVWGGNIERDSKLQQSCTEKHPFTQTNYNFNLAL